MDIMGLTINMATPELVAVIIIFVVFLVLMKKVIKVLFNILWIVLASAAFPVVLNVFFAFQLPLNLETVLFFIMIGIGLYFVYMVGKIIYSLLSLAEKSAKVVIPSRKKEEKE